MKDEEIKRLVKEESINRRTRIIRDIIKYTEVYYNQEVTIHRIQSDKKGVIISFRVE